MSRRGSGRAHGAITVVNAIPTGSGAAVGIDLGTVATVELDEGEGQIELVAENEPELDASLAAACVATVAERYGTSLHGLVRTRSTIPVARGLKSSSTAANAIVLAVLDALDEHVGPDDALALSVKAARDAGVTITGALDDAAASLIGGLVVTDNRNDRVLERKRLQGSERVLLLVPERTRLTSDVGDRLGPARAACERSLELVSRGRWRQALTLNGLATAAALDEPLSPAYRALAAGATAAGLTGTGPAHVALVDADAEADVRRAWTAETGHVLGAGLTNEGVVA